MWVIDDDGLQVPDSKTAHALFRARSLNIYLSPGTHPTAAHASSPSVDSV